MASEREVDVFNLEVGDPLHCPDLVKLLKFQAIIAVQAALQGLVQFLLPG